MADLATKRKARSKVKERPFRFLRSHAGETNLVENDSTKLLAECIVWQQRAGFGDAIDLRQTDCPTCHAHGYNTGWGYLAFTCGSEILTDGEESKPCRIVPSHTTKIGD